ncbi:MAG TPA: TspO/MBR family protein [Hyphomicrobiaceae bacterium]|nr:TspO/MBR family protein [Hyphomicrobiaceae bacterium]
MTGRSFYRLIGCLGLCLGVAMVSGSVTYPEIPTWYAALTKPSWTPPNWLFPLVWSVLYPAMAVTLWLLWDRAADTARRRAAITLFLLQLMLNAAWSPVFFGLHHPRAALIIIVLLAAAVAATIAAAWRAQRMAASLLGPYLAWVVYATTLNAGIVALNDL